MTQKTEALPRQVAPTKPDSPQPAHETVPAPVDPAARFLEWSRQQDRLYRVGGPILLNNTPLCPEHVRNLLGFTAKNRYSYSAEYVDEAQKYLGLDERLRITEVLNGSGAAQAGIREGDILLAVGIEPIPEGKHAETMASALVASERQGRSEVSLTVLRGSERMTVEVPLSPACAMEIDFGHSDEITAYADGRRVMIARGMLNFVASDDELAFVIAREVARNVLHPSLKPEEAKIIDQLRHPAIEHQPAPNTTVTLSSSPSFNPEIERLALYMLARSGYSLAGIDDFLDRVSSVGRPDGNAGPMLEVHRHRELIRGIVREMAANHSQAIRTRPP